jgi:hypothetical protein
MSSLLRAALAALLLFLPSLASAATSSVPGLPAGSAVASSDLFWCVQSAGTVDKKCTGTQILTWVQAGWGTGVATWVGTPSSANLRGAVSDETGTGLLYFQGGDLGTPSGGVATNITGLPIAGIAGLGSNVSSLLAAAVSAAADVQAGTSSTKAVVPSAIAGSGALQTLTDGATISWDVASGYNAKVTLTASGHTLAAPTNVIAGLTYQIWIIQDATGSRTMSWNAAYKFGTAGAPTLTTTAAAKDLITCTAYDTTPTLNCVAALGY